MNSIVTFLPKSIERHGRFTKVNLFRSPSSPKNSDVVSAQDAGSVLVTNRRIAAETTQGALPNTAPQGAGSSIQEQVRKIEASDIGTLGKRLGIEQPATKVFVPRYVRACQDKRWTLVTWAKDKPREKEYRCFECRSWRCTGKCSRANAAQWFARIKTAFDRSPSNWVFLTLTLDQRDWKASKGWTSEEVAFRESNKCWALLQDRLKYAFGSFAYVCSVEQHKKGWPHFHIAIQNERIAAACALDGWRKFRREWLKPNAQAVGFGMICHIEPARDNDAIAGYIVKCAGNPVALPGELVKESQLPVNAPKGFRRIRASKGFLPPKIKNEKLSGCLEMWAPEDLVLAVYERGQQKKASKALREASIAESVCAESEFVVDRVTGEVLSDLIGRPLLKEDPPRRRRTGVPNGKPSGAFLS